MNCFYQFFRPKVGGRTLLANVIVFALLAFLFLTANHFKQTPLRMGASGTGGYLAKPQMIEAYGKLPMTFEANQGQADEQVKFLARGSGYTLFLAANEAVLALRKPVSKEDQPSEIANPQSTVLYMKLVGANPIPVITGADELPGKSNYFIGNDSKKWQTGIPNYSKVKYQNVYHGVDLVYYGHQRQLEYDFIVQPGADPDQIVLAFEGTQDVRLDADNNLLLAIEDGAVTVRAPEIYQEIAGRKVLIAGQFRRRGDKRIGFEVKAYDSARPLVIDPVLVYSTYLGGSASDGANGIVVDAAGNVYLTGSTDSDGFPGVQAPRIGFSDVFVSKLSADGSSVLYSTYLGGSLNDAGRDIELDTNGNVYVAGGTSSTDFPAVNAYQPKHSAGTVATVASDGFVVKLNPSGNNILYSTYLGGSHQFELDPGFLNFGTVNVGQDKVLPVTVRNTGIAPLSGTAFTNTGQISVTSGSPFNIAPGAEAKLNVRAAPTFSSTQQFTINFVITLASGIPQRAVTTSISAEVNGTSSVTFLPRTSNDGDDYVTSIAVDAAGNAYVTGVTRSINFPTFRPLSTYHPLPNVDFVTQDAFVTKLNPAGSPIYSTYLGGRSDENGNGIAVDAAENAYITGVTYSSDFPTVNPYKANKGGEGPDAFVSQLNADGSKLLYSTYLGGSNPRFSIEEGTSIAVDAAGSAYVTGLTQSNDFPLQNPFQAITGGGNDVFVSKLSADGSRLLYSTYLGGSNSDGGSGIAVDAANDAYVIGSTSSDNFPTANPFQAVIGGGFGDAFVSKLSADGARLLYSTYLGGSGLDEGSGIAVDAAGNAYVTGNTSSANFLTKNPVQPNNAGGQDAFVVKIADTAPLPTVYVWQEFPIYRGSADFSAIKENNIVTFDQHKAEIISANKDSLIVRVPPELVGNRNNVLTLPDTTLREVPVVARVVRAPGDTIAASQSRVRFCPPFLLLYDEVTRPAPPLVQQVMPGRGPRNRQAFLFLGNQNDGTVAVRVLNTSTGFPQPSTLLVKVIAPSGELFDKSTTPTIGNLLNIGQNNAGIQFPVTQTGIYIIIVEADRTSSFGRFPTLFQIHLAGNAGLPRRLINGNPEPPRATRLSTLFNHPAPQPEILANAAPGFGRFAETALFKFANPVSTSQFPIAVLIPPAIDPAGFPFGIPPVRAAAPLVLGRLANGVIDITVPSATTPGAATPVPGTVVDFTQVPIPASVLAPGPPPGVAAILGAADGNGVTLPINLPAGGVMTSLIVDIGSGNEIVNGSGADFRVLGTSGAYAVAVSNTPFSNTFVALGTGTGPQDFDLSATGLTSIRYIRLSVPTGTATIDAIQSLHFFVDTIHPTVGPLADVGFATITMRRQKSPATSVDCLLELIAPDGSFLRKNESGFGDETSQDRSDAALIQMQLTQQGFYRYLGRGYDTQPDEQAFGNFFTRLETAGNYDKAKIQISANSETQTVAQKQGRIDLPRQRDSFLFVTAPGTALSIVVNGVSNPSLADPLIELYDPEDFLIAANDNFSGRGKNAALTVTLPTIGRAGGAFPNPSTYRIVVTGIDGESGPPTPVSNGVAHLRQANGGNYELKVFTGALAGGAAPAIAGITPGIAAQGAANLAITINGNNFANGARVTFSESGITANTVNFVSSTQLQVTIDIAATAPIGRRNVIVTNPDAQSGTGTGIFEVRKSLGTSNLTWEAPTSGQALAPPANLKLQFGGGLQGAKANAGFILAAGKRKPSGSGRRSFASPLTSNLIDEIEPNNKPSQAQILAGASPLALKGSAEVQDVGEIVISFNEGDDDDLEDLFKVTTTAPGLAIVLDGFASDCDLYLFNSDLSEIIDESINGDENPPEEIDLPNLVPDTYFIAVTIFDPDPIGSDTTAYVLNLKGQFAGKATLQSYNIFRSTSANAKSTGTRVGTVNASATSFSDPMPHTGNFFYQVTAVYDQGESASSNEATILVTRVEDDRSAVVPAGFDLHQNYPNPFNPETRIQFELPKSTHVKIEICNVQGRTIRTLVDAQTPAGLHTVQWDGRMDSGEPAASGIYIYRLKTSEHAQSRKLLLLR